MKIRVTSDWHLEFWQGEEGTVLGRSILPELPDDDETVLVIAGDVTTAGTYGRLAMTLARHVSRFALVLFVPGNHDYWKQGKNKGAEEEMRDFWNGLPNARNLQTSIGVTNDARDVALIGRTLWTDYNDGHKTCLRMADRYMADYRPANNLDPEELLKVHDEHEAGIRDFLDNFDAEKKVVVTHHLPSHLSVDKRYAGEYSNHYFASNLDELVGQADLWIHGHTHHNCDYYLNGCRVVCNPFGYPRENAGYDPEKVIKV